MEESLNRPRVVIAEDFVLIQEGIRLAIQQHCDVVAAVEDGEAALDAVAKHSPDILLLDVSLPKIKGFAVAEKLMRARSAVKVIFVSAYCDKNYAAKAFEMGAMGYVLKGAIEKELPTAIREVSSGHSYRSPGLA